MNHIEAGEFWNNNADAWTKLSRAGYDVYRDFLNTPAFCEMLPIITDLSGLDIGCGEGSNTRHLAKAGAKMSGIDISDVFISYAKEIELKEHLNIDYQTASAVQLPFLPNTFDFATGFMSFMDIPETNQVLSEAYRVIAPGGFLQFSIEHPCFATSHRRNLRDDNGTTYAIEVGKYFHKSEGAISEWLFGNAPKEIKKVTKPFKVPKFTRTLSEWLNLIVAAGFVIEEIREPYPTDDVVKKCPDMQDAQVVAYFLHIRARKPK
jgi:ubiquinone/menaquinone biosynthesis C-methylase UbiE